MTDQYGLRWHRTLTTNHLAYFNQLWILETDWFEPPNIRRGGWSGVVKMPLKNEGGQSFFIFIKRQENHLSRTWRHPLTGIPTFQKEYENLQRFYRHQIPTQELVYFGTRTYNGNRQAVITTKELAGYYPLDQLLSNSDLNLAKDRKNRHCLIQVTAKVLSHMHQQHIQHNSLYPKHIFAKPVGDGWDVRLIDLEKAKRRLFKSTAILRDLSTLRRHTLDWTIREQVTFFKAYVNEVKLSSDSKRLWYKIQDRILNKSK